ncbi:Abortive infection bacteriophage resistance protein [Tissierella praeacuta DSM 18095]|uniref:Abortive infection bacteriophage resistance protein n=1 Tax=Tissierella praeacuta DSM 18095 TaxID=1123404 RepID=A0A1M4WG46_9FIRM|nr:Abi family protein [Tissierella praeacuta]SHE79932.1 Abortive infection bacteriophage resistance protein [Tissierella praeacuta DSM 18095]SUO99482.1 Abortive infection bacteriophage resistance protein [Tissierella praeacuta]
MDKPFLTFDEQIEKLKNDYNLIIDNYEFAREALSSISYYDLVNGYQSIYMIDAEYIEGTTIEHLTSTHIFNKNIQGVLFKYATYVENSFKTLLSHIIAERFTEHQDEYLDIKYYKKGKNSDQKTKLRKLLDKLKGICKECEDTPTQYYRNTKDHIPPWILFRNISFSDTTDLFYFLKREEKEYLFTFLSILNTDTLEFQDKVNIMLSSLKVVRKFRNKIAHNLNFLAYRKSSLNKKANLLYENTLFSEKEITTTFNNVWAMVVSIVILLNNKYLSQNFLAEFQSFMKFDENLIEIYCKVTGIPLDYEKRIWDYMDTLEF